MLWVGVGVVSQDFRPQLSLLYCFISKGAQVYEAWDLNIIGFARIILSKEFFTKSNHTSNSKRFCLFYIKKKKLLFLFYTITFIKHQHQFIYYTHFFIKIIFFLTFSIISHLLPPNTYFFFL